MAQDGYTEVRIKKPRPGLISKLLGLAFQAASGCLGAWLLAIAIEFAGLLWLWPEQGAGRARAMLAHEIGYLDGELTRSLLSSDPARFAADLVLAIRHWAFERTGILPWLRGDLARIRAGIEEYLNEPPAVPRAIAPLRGDYRR